MCGLGDCRHLESVKSLKGLRYRDSVYSKDSDTCRCTCCLLTQHVSPSVCCVLCICACARRACLPLCLSACVCVYACLCRLRRLCMYVRSSTGGEDYVSASLGAENKGFQVNTLSTASTYTTASTSQRCSKQLFCSRPRASRRS